VGAGSGGDDADVFDGVDAVGLVVGQVSGLQFGAGVVGGVVDGLAGGVDQSHRPRCATAARLPW